MCSLWLLQLCLCTALPSRVEAAESLCWIGSWESSPTGLSGPTELPPHLAEPTLVQGTVRYRLRLSAGGSRLRLKFTNEYGAEPLILGAASVGLAKDGFDVSPGSLRGITFGGRAAITIPAGAPALSDAVDLPVKPLADLIVSIYIPAAIQTDAPYPTRQVLIPDVNATAQERVGDGEDRMSRPIVSEVDVFAEHRDRVVVTLGDSITDGVVDAQSGERGWPGTLSARVAAHAISVVNAGIGGNRLLQEVPVYGRNALARLNQDVFAVPGVTDLIVLEGINDIGMSGPGSLFYAVPLVKPGELAAALSQIITRAHERGVRVIAATLGPFEGAFYYTPEKEFVRQAYNDWIRASKELDGFVDFDKVLRDPQRPSRLQAQYDSGDHLHPSADGYRAMGAAIDLRLFN